MYLIFDYENAKISKLHSDISVAEVAFSASQLYKRQSLRTASFTYTYMCQFLLCFIPKNTIWFLILRVPFSLSGRLTTDH